MRDNRDAIDFATEPVGVLFRKMFLPTLIGMVSMVVLNITDGAFVGHGAGSDALAAVNIVAPLFMITGGLGLMFGIGSSVVASIHYSKGNKHAADLNLTQGVLASVLTGILLSAAVLTFQQQTCRLFGCSERLIPLACSYLKWIALFSPFNMAGMTGMFMVRLDGSPRFAMVVNCGMALLNIVLDYVFIFPLGMGLEGAAIATSTAFSLGNIPMFAYLFRYTSKVNFHPLKLSRKSMLLTARNLVYQMKIGLSGLLGELSISSVIIIGNYMFIRYLGEDGVAAYSVGCYCLPIAFMMGNAIVNSAQPIISYAHGVSNRDRLHEALRVSLLTAVLTGLTGMAFMWVGAGFITQTFLPAHCHAAQLCRQGLPLFAPAFLFATVNIVLIGYLQSTEAVRQAMFHTLLRGILLSIPIFVTLPMLIGPAGLWLALPLAEGLTTGFFFLQKIRTA